MLSWIIAVIVLYTIGLFLPASMALFKAGLAYAAGPRDEPVPETVTMGRARRAHENFKESLPVFLALGILTMIVGEGPTALAVTGAMIFFIARVAYIPLYVLGVHFVRTLVWTAGCVGLICMAVSLY